MAEGKREMTPFGRKLRILSSYLLTRFTGVLARTPFSGIPLKIRMNSYIPFLRSNSPFYSRLNDFPVIDKKIWMENFDRINTKGIKLQTALKVSQDPYPLLGDTTVLLSTGTSGNQGLQLTGPSEHAQWTGSVLAKLLPKSILHKQKIALFLRANSQIYETINSTRIVFRYFPLGENLGQQQTDLEAFQPDIIVAPPSMLKLMTGWKLSPIKIISCAEVLSPEDKSFLSQAFRQTIHEIYQCTEGFLGATCPLGNMHLNEDLVLFEKVWIDQESRRFNVLVTDPQRTTQPVVRYSLNDILVESAEPCPCGSRFTRIERIEGRCDDIFTFGDKRIFPDYIRRAIVTASPTISEYQVTQVSEDLLKIQLQTIQSEDPTRVRKNLEALFKDYGVNCPRLEFVSYEETSPSVKKRRIRKL